MGACHGKPLPVLDEEDIPTANTPPVAPTAVVTAKPWKLSFLSPNPSPSPSPNPRAYKSSPGTPMRIFKRPFPPPSPAKHIKALLARRHGSVKPNEAAIPECAELERGGLDKRFGFAGKFAERYELGEEVGRGHFGYTKSARGKKGEMKGEEVAVKVIPKAKV